jgi:hypothetical protein
VQDPNWLTFLYHAAANVLCDADPDEKAKRRAERDLRVSVNDNNSEVLPSSWDVPPEGERQEGTTKLIDWLLEANPQACGVRDSYHRLPLQLALETGKVWDNGVESRVKAAMALFRAAIPHRFYIPSCLLQPPQGGYHHCLPNANV